MSFRTKSIVQAFRDLLEAMKSDPGNTEKTEQIIDYLERTFAEVEDMSEFQEKAEEISGMLDTFKQDILPQAKSLINGHKDDLKEVVRILAGLLVEIFESSSDDIKNYYKVRGQILKSKYDSYVQAGFSKSDAFKILLSEIKPINFSEIIEKARAKIDK